MLISEMSDEQKKKLYDYPCKNNGCTDCICKIEKGLLREHNSVIPTIKSKCYHNIQNYDPLCKKEESLIDIDISKLE